MEQEILWDNFIRSGKISDYLETVKKEDIGNIPENEALHDQAP